MGFLDSLRGRLLGGSDDYYEEDDYYEDDEEYYDDEPVAQATPASTRQRGRQETAHTTGSGLLGNTPRPEAESVSVYTRSGRPIVQGQSGTFESREEERRAEERRREALERQRAQRTYQPKPAQAQQPVQAQLPPYVLRPTAYDDVQSVIRRVRTNQPVIIILTATAIDTARRILDFCFGFSCGIEGSVEELAERIYVVLPKGATISESDIERLVEDGEIQR